MVTLVGGARLPCPGWGCPDCTPTPTPCGALRPADCPAPRWGGTQRARHALLREPRFRHPRKGPPPTGHVKWPSFRFRGGFSK